MTLARAPLRVAIVIGHLGYGGAERQLTELARRAPERGILPHVFCLGGVEEPYGSELRACGIELSSIPRRGGFDLRRALTLAGELRSRSFDLVHSFLIDTNPYGFLAARLARIPRFIASNRNADFPRGRVRAAIDGFVFRRASTVLVNARAVESFTAARFRVPSERFSLVYNGVDLSRFRPTAAAAESSLTIGTVGSLYPKKNPELFAEVATRVGRRIPGVRCRHLGDGPMRERLVARHGAAIDYVGVSPAVEEFLQRLDVFVLTSDREGCPNVLLEAMACARAVVTTRAGGVPEIVREGTTGYIVPLGDADGLTGRVCSLLADPALRSRLGGAARAEIETHFSVARMVEDTVSLYRAVAGGSATKVAA